jgi:hypothetical protein
MANQAEQALFSFTFNPETKKVVFAGNIDVMTALSILQGVAIDVSTRNALEADRKKREDESKAVGTTKKKK